MMMGTIRFSKIVDTAGKPTVHTLWIEPGKDSFLQNAIKANRVMTIHQRPAGTKTDYGTVGFEKKVSGEVLIFPKSIRAFADMRVIGVNYDLLDWPATPRSQEAPKPQPPKPPLKNKPKQIPLVAVEQPVVKESALPEIQQALKVDPAKPAIKSKPREISVAAVEQPVVKENALPKIQQAPKADPAKPAIKSKPGEISVAAVEQPVVKENALPKIQQAPKADPAKPAIKSKPREISVAAVEQPVAKESALPKIQQAPKAGLAKPAIKSKPKEIPVAAVEPVVKESASNRVVKFPTPTFENKNQPNEGIAQIKEQVRQAMKALEEGRQVAAFNLLKRIVE
jgi:hypothetical protein